LEREIRVREWGMERERKEKEGKGKGKGEGGMRMEIGGFRHWLWGNKSLYFQVLYVTGII